MKVKLSISAIPYEYEGKVEVELLANFDNGDWIGITTTYVDESSRKYTFDNAYENDGTVYDAKWNGKVYNEVYEDELRDIIGDSVMDVIINWYTKKLKIEYIEDSIYLANIVSVTNKKLLTALDDWNEEETLTID